MHYVKFIKDHPTYGKKEGQIVRFMNKVPPHLKKYVTKSSQTAFEKQQEDAEEEAERSARAPKGEEQGAVDDSLRKQDKTQIATPEDRPKRNPKLPNDVIDKPQID